MIIKTMNYLRPNAQMVVRDETYSSIEWYDERPIPTEEEYNEAYQIVEQQVLSERYKGLREPEYPSINEYLDGVVKGDQEQIQAYVDACMAIKTKYPK